MQCPACNNDNPDGAKFCFECGAKLAVVCSECGATLPPQAKFCFECGARLGVPPPLVQEPVKPTPGASERLAERLQRLIPREFAERLLATRGQVEGERRIVTILFSDVKGSTAMAEEMDPEDVMMIMDGAFDALIEPIYRHEGTLARLMGDAILAFFGAPISHEDDPERAVRAALEIVAGVQQYAAQLEAEQGIEGFGVRVGINTGLVVVGEVGSDLRVEYTAMGDAINLAARMEQHAPVDGILISHDTYRHVRGLFEMQALEPVLVKGKREPVRVYRVERAKRRPFRLSTRGVAGVQTRMVGRESELKALQDSLYLAMEDRERQMVTIVGEAGLGKSRLLYEFEAWADLLPQRINYFRGRASQEMQARPYALLRDLFALRFELQDSDPREIIHEKLERGIAGVLGAGPESEPKSHLIGQLLGFDFGDSPHLREVLDDAQQLHDRALAYLVEFFQAATVLDPAIIFLDDIHWADDSSLDAVNHLAQTLPNQPLLFVCLARPSLFERRPHWGEGQLFHTRLELSALSKLDGRRLVDEILQNVQDVPTTLRQLVVSGAEGNPLYVEELINILIEDGVIVPGQDMDAPWRIEPERLAEMRVPPTLTGVLQARLDSLPLAERMTLQQASVVGRKLWRSAVERLRASAEDGADDREIEEILAALRGKAMLFRRETSVFDDTEEYLFKHAVLHEVTYEGILKRVRRTYHRLVADWLIEQSGERTGEYTGLIAEHLEAAGQVEQALAYLRRAGESAAAQCANAEAVEYFGRALRLVEQTDWEPARAREVRYALLLGREGVYGLLGEREPQAADLASLAALAEEMGSEQQAQVALRRFVYHEAVSDYPAALAAAQEAVALAERASSADQKIEGLVDWSIALWRQGAFDEAQERLEEALALLAQHANPRLEAEALLNLGVVCYFLGDLQATLDRWEQALALRRELGDRRGQALCLSNMVAVYHGLGDLAQAKAYAQQALLLYQTIGDRQGEARALTNFAGSLRAVGDLAARDSYERALTLCRAIGDRGGEALASKCVGLTYLDAEVYPDARQYFGQALAIEHEIGDRRGEGESLTYLGLALEGLGEAEPAITAYQEALQLRQEIGQAALAMDNLAGLARVALERDQIAEALAHSDEILDWIAEHDVDSIESPARVYLTLADVLAATGRDEQAAEILSSAHAWLQEQASRISDEAMRRTFLEQVPLHRQLLERFDLAI